VDRFSVIALKRNMVWNRTVKTVIWPITHFTLECEGTGIVGKEQIRTLQTSLHIKVLSSSLCYFLIK